jgi:ribosomal protein S18 acetylase RimI-like enzyme
MAEMLQVREGTPGDIDNALEVWRSANTARRGGRPLPEATEPRVRGYLDQPKAIFLVAEDREDVVGMGLGLQGLEDDGAGPPIPGLCHISAVFVAPDLWGEGIGRKIMLALMSEALARGYERAQLWTHADNERARRLYEGLGFKRSGREKDDDFGDRIVHCERPALT